MEDRICCYASYKSCTRVIGWLQIIGTLFLFTRMAEFLISEGISYAQNSKINVHEYAILQAVILLFLMVLSFLAAIVLLRGSHNKNPRQLQAWIVTTAICLVINVLVYTAIYYNLAPTTTVSIGPNAIIIREVAVIALGFLSMSIVHNHKQELEESMSHTCDVPMKGVQYLFSLLVLQD